ncbi:MAG: hypothetical protein QXT28_06180 [Thermofilaceae archaeon]
MPLTEEELRKLVREKGARIYRYGSRFFVYVPGEQKKLRVPVELSHVAEELWLQQESGKVAQRAIQASDVVKELSRQYAQLVSLLGGRVSWFAEALMDIGFSALLASLAFAKVPPDEFARKVQEFNDAGEFSRFVLKYLEAMVQSSMEGAKTIADLSSRLEQLEKELGQWQAYAKLAEGVALRLAGERDEALRRLQLAAAIACDDCKRRMMLAEAFASRGGG